MAKQAAFEAVVKAKDSVGKHVYVKLLVGDRHRTELDHASLTHARLASQEAEVIIITLFFHLSILRLLILK